uniref:Uncharacterized protein n=1 Tax=Romanomermis culicivorax TaxID=13658 RepID=A0A915J7Q0_ROMCU
MTRTATNAARPISAAAGLKSVKTPVITLPIPKTHLAVRTNTEKTFSTDESELRIGIGITKRFRFLTKLTFFLTIISGLVKLSSASCCVVVEKFLTQMLAAAGPPPFEALAISATYV